MDITLLKKASLQSVILMFAVITLSYALKQYHAVTITASDRVNIKVVNKVESNLNYINNPLDNKWKEQIPSTTRSSLNQIDYNIPISNINDLKNRVDPSILNKLSDKYLVIKKPKGNNIHIQLQDLYMNQSIQLDITGISKDKITSDMIFRVRGKDLFQREPQYTEITTLKARDEDGPEKEIISRDYGKDLSHGIIITNQEDKVSQEYATKVLIELDSIYAYITYEDNNYYYIDLRKPSESYDKIIVIDSGHGGKDAGAISKDNKYYEKDINLGIVTELKKLLDKEDIKVYYTRAGDDKVFLRPRVNLANTVDCDYFISIHCNSNEVTYPNGTEVLYYNNYFKGIKASSLAELFSEEIGKSIDLKQKGIIKKQYEDIFIMDKALVPTILIEVGYLSNKYDMDYLSKAENRREVAKGIYNGIMRAYDELPVSK